MGKGTRFLANAAFAAALASPLPPMKASAKSAAPAAVEKPPVPLKLTLTESGPDEEWQLAIQNVSSVPVRLFDDPRVLTLEVASPGQKKPKTCKLPDELFPKDVTEAKMKEVRPGGTIRHKVDPRFYCFSPGAQQVLIPSAQVTPHYGFAGKTKKRWRAGKQLEEKLPDTEPFIANPVGSDALGPVKNVAGDLIVLDARYKAWSDKPAHDATDDGEPDGPTVEMVKGSDAQSEPNVLATVRVRNPMHHRLVLFLRRELLTFEVMTPSGSISCSAEPDARNPDRRAFSTVRPGGSVTLVSRLVELCPRGTFATPGLYIVHAELDAPANGADYGLDAFTGTLHTERPVAVRVRRALQIIPNRLVPASTAAAGTPPPGLPPGVPPAPGAAPAAPGSPPPPEAPPPPPPPPPQ